MSIVLLLASAQVAISSAAALVTSLDVRVGLFLTTILSLVKTSIGVLLSKVPVLLKKRVRCKNDNRTLSDQMRSERRKRRAKRQ